MCPAMFQLYSSCVPDVSSYVPAAVQMCSRCVQLCARCIQLCARCAFGLYASCVQIWPTVCQLCTRCALDVCWTVHYCTLDCTPLYTVHWIVHTVCTLDCALLYTGLCTTIHWTVKKFKQVPAWCLIYHGHTSFEHIYAKWPGLMMSGFSFFWLFLEV